MYVNVYMTVCMFLCTVCTMYMYILFVLYTCILVGMHYVSFTLYMYVHVCTLCELCTYMCVCTCINVLS